MRVTQVGIRPTQASEAAGRPSLTPELLAATGARYSRNNEGLEAILERIDPANLDKSVDGIFRMIDYGHQSIADMAPVAMFIDGISIWLAYHVWSLCPTAGGQESSSRYIKIAQSALIEPQLLGIGPELYDKWQDAMQSAFDAYAACLSSWQEQAMANPSLMRIPESLLEDQSEKAVKQVARMRRNYGFDRARYYLPVAAKTNVMLVMSARGWVQLAQALLSHTLPEAKNLGEGIRRELELSAPRLIRHSEAKTYIRDGLAEEFERMSEAAGKPSVYLEPGAVSSECPPDAFLEVSSPANCESGFAGDLSHHENRYAWFGEGLRRTAVRFGWSAVAFAEIRDLNRHRTGAKHVPLVPLGFYSALDQLGEASDEIRAQILKQNDIGRSIMEVARKQLGVGDPAYVYWMLLGAQCPFEHLTTADKYIYEAELRTGSGAHYRYAKHLKDSLELWYSRYPQTRGLVLEGTAEPE